MKKLKSPLALLLTGTAAFLFVACDSTSETAPPPSPEAPETAEPATTEAAETATKIDHVDAKGAAELLASESKPVVLDVRTPEEFGEGHIEGATMIDFKAPDFESKISELDRDQTYLVHCRSGSRSTNSLATFEKLGFKHIIHLDGGFNAWQEAGEPVAK